MTTTPDHIRLFMNEANCYGEMNDIRKFNGGIQSSFSQIGLFIVFRFTGMKKVDLGRHFGYSDSYMGRVILYQQYLYNSNEPHYDKAYRDLLDIWIKCCKIFIHST